MRTIIAEDPYLPLNEGKDWREMGCWPCSWIGCADAGAPPFVCAFRLRFTLAHAATIRAHVSADERYELFLDGARIGRGSEQGAPDCWFYETYDLALDAGAHVLVARVWALGPRVALAQMSVRPGFLFATEREWIERLGTGIAPWQAKRLDGYTFTDPAPAHWRGDNVCIDGSAFPWGFEQGHGDGWQPVSVLAPAISRRVDWELPPQHVLQPATLPPMLEHEYTSGTVRFVADVPTNVPAAHIRAMPLRAQDHRADEQSGWIDLVQGRGSVTVPPHRTRRAIIDLEDYYCAYPEVVISGGEGSMVHVLWAESLFHELNPLHGDKGNRDEIENKYFIGIGDVFLPAGGMQRRFETLWWQAGRYVELIVQTATQPLIIEQFVLHETRYPLEMESAFAADDPRLEAIIPLLVRGMQMNAHEVFSDCPYYEQLMYIGDARLEALLAYIMSRDDRLPRKALRLFDVSRLPSGLTQARYPSRQLQIIAPFALWWVAMVHDYALWRDDRAFVESLMPGVRATIESFRRWMGPDGLLHAPEGWNTLDWVPEWTAGMPPDGATGVSGVLNWQLVYALALVADLEARLGEPELAARGKRQAAELAARMTEHFWDEQRGLFADDLARQCFSEHTQCFALLSGQLDSARHARVADGVLHDQNLAHATIYFSHYLFETYRAIGRGDALFPRLELWFDLKRQGLKTPLESPEPSRSDCHAWGSHPLYHYFATILGIRPADLGFRTVEIAPQLCPLQHASGQLVHLHGEINVEFRVEDGRLRGSVSLPEGVTGTLRYGGEEWALTTGRQTL